MMARMVRADGMNRLTIALGAYAVLAILALVTIDDQKFRLATLAVLAMFAVRTWSWSRKQEREDRDGARRAISERSIAPAMALQIGYVRSDELEPAERS